MLIMTVLKQHSIGTHSRPWRKLGSISIEISIARGSIEAPYEALIGKV